MAVAGHGQTDRDDAVLDLALRAVDGHMPPSQQAVVTIEVGEFYSDGTFLGGQIPVFQQPPLDDGVLQPDQLQVFFLQGLVPVWCELQ